MLKNPSLQVIRIPDIQSFIRTFYNIDIMHGNFHFVLLHSVCAHLRSLAAGLGFEPRLMDSESTFLPLEDPAIDLFYIKNRRFSTPVFDGCSSLKLHFQKSSDGDRARDNAQRHPSHEE